MAFTLFTGDRIWNTTTQTYQLWNGTIWIDIGGGGGGGGGHLNISGGTLIGGVPLYNFEDHDKFNTSWMWNYRTVPEITPFPPLISNGAISPSYWQYDMDNLPNSLWNYGLEWLGAGNGEDQGEFDFLHSTTAWPFFDDWLTEFGTGGITPTMGVDVESDSGIILNCLNFLDEEQEFPWNPKHMMVKGFMNLYDPTSDNGWNSCIGFMVMPFSGHESVIFGRPWINTGIYFVGGFNLPTPLGANPGNWYAVASNGGTVYALDTGIAVDDGDTGLSENHKFHVRFQFNGAQFYIDNLLVATMDTSDPDVADAWPVEEDLYPGVGISNTGLAESETGKWCGPIYFLPWIAASEIIPDVPTPPQPPI